MDLMELTKGCLEAKGYTIQQRGRDMLVGYGGVTLSGETETILVWVPPIGSGPFPRSLQGPYLSSFEKVPQEYQQPGYRIADKIMLVETLNGIGPDFQSNATALDVHIQLPIWFFDSPLKYEVTEGADVRSVAKDLKLKGEDTLRSRVPQPYTVGRGTEKIEHSADLLETLQQNVIRGLCSGLNLIVGPAGIGKTFLFETLYARLYSLFRESKTGQRHFSRPIPLVPAYFSTSKEPTLTELIEGLVRTEFAARVDKAMFEWMLANGFAIWMIDGLDELIDRDHTFIPYLRTVLRLPGTRQPVIILCVRDSLLALNEDLRDLCEQDHVTIYELLRWERPSKLALARIKLGEEESQQFMSILQTNSKLRELTEIPFYCDLIIEEHKAGQLQGQYTEAQLLNRGFSSIIEREYRKGLLPRAILPPARVAELLEELASLDFDLGFQGLREEDIGDYTELHLPDNLPQEVADDLRTRMAKHAVFSSKLEPGSVTFAQEVVECYLLGAYLSRKLVTNDVLFLRELGRQSIPSEWVTLKVVAEKARERNNVSQFLQWLHRSALSDTAFRNLVQIYAYAAEDKSGLIAFPFERRDLSGIRFEDLDLSGSSFKGCNLTNVEFNKCRLRDADFESATINNTALLHMEKADLEGARFGDMKGFHSLRIGPQKWLSDYSVAKKWLQQRTGEVFEISKPCATATQFKLLIRKFLHPNGNLKRRVLEIEVAVDDPRLSDPKRMLTAAIRYGYFIPDPERYRKRVWICGGDLLTELVNYVKDFTLAPTLRELLDGLCLVKKCKHVPTK